MPRVTLLSLQVLVAVVALALCSFSPLLPIFGHMVLPPFFSFPPRRSPSAARLSTGSQQA